MNYNDVLKLIKETVSVDSFGDRIITRTERTVFCDVRSITQSEFYSAQAVGFRPEIKFVLSDYFEYEQEAFIEYNGEVYSVIRTYRNNNELEIICRKGIE